MKNSRCYITSNSGSTAAGCYLTQCVGGVVQVTVNGIMYKCLKTGQLLEINGQLRITCPEIAGMCGSIHNNCIDLESVCKTVVVFVICFIMGPPVQIQLNVYTIR